MSIYNTIDFVLLFFSTPNYDNSLITNKEMQKRIKSKDGAAVIDSTFRFWSIFKHLYFSFDAQEDYGSTYFVHVKHLRLIYIDL